MDYKPWFKSEFKRRITERKHLYFLIKNKSKNELIPQYEKVRDHLKREMRKAEMEYYDQLFEKHKNDSKETWKLINNIVNKQKNKAVFIKKIKKAKGIS